MTTHLTKQEVKDYSAAFRKALTESTQGVFAGKVAGIYPPKSTFYIYTHNDPNIDYEKLNATLVEETFLNTHHLCEYTLTDNRIKVRILTPTRSTGQGAQDV